MGGYVPLNMMDIDQAHIIASVDRFEEFLLKPRGDRLIRVSVSRNTLLAIIFSILTHVLILFLVIPHIRLNNASAPPQQAIEVSLAPPISAKAIIPNLKIPEEPKLKVIKTKPKVIVQKFKNNIESSTFSVPDLVTQSQPTPESILSKDSGKDAPVDMMAYVNSKRAQRQALEADAAKQNAAAAAREIGPNESQMRDERIKNNFQNGTNGIFEITSLSGRHAAFSFRGWTNDYSTSRREAFEVEAKAGQDVRLVMIKKMIMLIREHYQGDFNWDSQRLGRVIVQSARLEDNAGLEDFMMMEFFGTNYKSAS